MKSEQRYDLIVEADWEPCRTDTGELSSMMALCFHHGFTGESDLGAKHYDTPMGDAIEVHRVVKHEGCYVTLKWKRR